MSRPPFDAFSVANTVEPAFALIILPSRIGECRSGLDFRVHLFQAGLLVLIEQTANFALDLQQLLPDGGCLCQLVRSQRLPYFERNPEPVPENLVVHDGLLVTPIRLKTSGNEETVSPCHSLASRSTSPRVSCEDVRINTGCMPTSAAAVNS